MRLRRHLSIAVILGILATGDLALGADPSAVALPAGVKAVWDATKAHRETTPTRERICINGLWRWQPAGEAADAVPAGRWGYFKVPGAWPGVNNYLQKDCQTVHAHPSWKDQQLGGIAAAWYQREIDVPGEWSGRRVALRVEYLNSYAVVFVDGKKAGEIRFPGGELDLTPLCRPGGKHVLSLLVVAMPLQGVMLSYNDTASAREVKGSVPRRGICGDVTLVSTPPGPRIADLRTQTSVRTWEIAMDAGLLGLAADAQYALRARIAQAGRNVAEFTGHSFRGADLKQGRVTMTEKWKPDRLWDVHTPGNVYELSLSLLDAEGKVLDTAHPERFGFREFWIDGRDFYLNGTRIFLSCVPLDNAQIGAAAATYEAAKESMLRLMSFGINAEYMHNYGCEPGSHFGFGEILRAADDVGMLVSFSQPHFGHYKWQAPDADRDNGYARHAEFYVRAAQNHPSVVFYSMSHNGTGYSDDMNPDMIDGIEGPRDTWSLKNSRLALRAESIVRRLDPGRIVYHHSGGNLGAMHTVNFYPNFVPIQEMSDWFEHWSTRGVKPAFTCEYGAPFTWDWTMYRGWYKGQRSFGNAAVPWELCFAEWNAQFLGDRAFRIGEEEKANLRWETRQFRAGRTWHRWDYPFEVGSTRFDDRYAVFAAYMTDNWRAFRTWGLSANSPWEHEHFWRLRSGANRGREELAVDWENLQRPGFSPDYLDARYERMDQAFRRSDWVATPAAESLLRNNRPLLAYLGGKAERFTSKDHNFHPGETVEKQVIVINNSRESVTCECNCSLELSKPLTGGKKATVAPGQQARLPLHLALPAALAPGAYPLNMTADFSTGESQKDSFTVHVLAIPEGDSPIFSATGGTSLSAAKGVVSEPATPFVPQGVPPNRQTCSIANCKIAIFDPKGETGRMLHAMGLRCDPVEPGAGLSGYDLLVIGKAALTLDGPGPDLGRVRDGLKVIVFEQTSEVLERRLGFRVEEYGLRQVFKRVPDHPALAGLDTENLRDWRGEATLLPPKLKYEMRPMYGPTIKWCDIPVTRPWRCGNHGNVASVLVEKPARGDFLPIVDGGFSLQYSPLLEYREGQGMVLFCQMDVTGRTESEPAAQRLARNLLDYAAAWKPRPGRKALYAGDPAGKSHLERAGVSVQAYEGGPLAADHVLIVGPGGGRKLAASAAAVGEWLRAGGHLLAIGLDPQDADALLPFKITMKKAEHIATCFEPPGADSLLAGVGPADVHNRDPRQVFLVSGGAAVLGDGVLAESPKAGVAFLQLVPWEFDASRQFNLKRTYRRASFALSRLLAGMGVAGSTPLLERFGSPVVAAKPETRWLDGLYLDRPEEMDDPYRFFRW